MRTHYENCVDHSIRRVKQHYGLSFSKDDIMNMSKKIRDQESIPLPNAGTKTRSRSFHRLFYKGTWFRIVYSKKLKVLVTVLKPDNIPE